MKKIEKLNRTKTYMYPNSAIATPAQVLKDFPAIEHFTHIIETDSHSEILYGIMNLNAMRSQMGIDPALNEAEAIRAIETKMNEVPEQEISPEERIAASLEMQNLLSMDNI